MSSENFDLNNKNRNSKAFKDSFKAFLGLVWVVVIAVAIHACRASNEPSVTTPAVSVHGGSDTSQANTKRP